MNIRPIHTEADYHAIVRAIARPPGRPPQAHRSTTMRAPALSVAT